MSTSDKENDDDAALFRAAIGAVQPLTPLNRITTLATPRHAYLPDTASVVEIPDTLSDFFNSTPANEYLGNGISRMSLRKLRHNHWPVQDQLDLHGLQSDAARHVLQEFLHHAGERQQRCVLVIHGKGLNSASGEAVLKMRTRHWLMQHPSVLAYCDAPPNKGGSGAVLVLLKTSRQQD